MRRALLIAVLGAGAVTSPALAGDRQLVAALDARLAPTAAASRAAAGGAPGPVQIHYDRARDLQERIRRAGPFSVSCHALGGWAGRYAAAEVAAAEGFDRLDPARARRERARAGVARDRVAAARRVCRPGPPAVNTQEVTLLEPRPFAVSFGDVVAAAPAGVDGAVLYANGVSAGPLGIDGGRARGRIVAPAGRYALEVRFTRGGVPAGSARSTGVWLLPISAGGAVRDPSRDTGLQDALRAEAKRFPGISGIWVHDLASGASAGWNAGARFPAASTVKLGVLGAALRRTGAQPEGSALFHDLQGIAGWSSNLGANRLLRTVGGTGPVQAQLFRLGATTSTYPGPYIVATALPPVDAPDPPPRVSRRLTTAYDLGAVLTTLHQAALGDPATLARSRMTRSQARLGLGLLLSSEQRGDNRGLLSDAVGGSIPMAQKQGWISSARHTAAIVYTAHGPVVVVVLTYRPGITRAAAAALGRAVLTRAGV